MLPGRNYTPEDFLRIAWRRKWLILLPLVIVSIAAALITRRLPDVYRSETTILVVPQRVPESYVRSTVTDRIEDRLKSMQQQILSRSRLERIIADLGLSPETEARQTVEDLIEYMRASVKVVASVRGDAFTVSYESRNPQAAQLVTARVTSLFIEENVKDRVTLAEGTSKFLQVQLDEAKQKLIDREKQLEAYRLQHAGELPSQAVSNLQALQNARMSLQSIVDSMNRNRDRQADMERQIADLLVPDGSTPAITAAAPAPTGAPGDGAGLSPAERLQQAREHLTVLEGRLKPQHPDVIRQRRVVTQLEQTLGSARPATAAAEGPASPPKSILDVQRERHLRETRANLESVKRRIASEEQQQARVQGEIALYQARLEAAPVRESELTELNRDYETLQVMYRGLLAKREESKISANLEKRYVGEQFKVLDPARVPDRPFSPNRARANGLGALLGLMIGLGLVALLEFMDVTLKSEDDVRVVLGLPVIATVPMMLADSQIPLDAARRRGWWPFAAGAGAVVGLVAVLAWTLKW